MNIKWAVGAVIAVLAATLVLPGVASAHHPVLSSDIACTTEDGTFTISADYVGGNADRILVVKVDGTQVKTPTNGSNNNIPSGYAPDGTQIIPDGMTGTINENNDPFNWTDDRDRWESDGASGFDNFFVLEGNYNSLVNNGGSVDVGVDMYDGAGGLTDTSIPDSNNRHINSNNTNQSSSSYNPAYTLHESVSTDDFWAECGLEICLDGETGVEVLSFQNSDTEDCDPASICIDGDSVGGTEFEVNQLTGTNDCAPVRLCVEQEDGSFKSETVTEFDAEQLEAEEGSCTPSEEPPPTTVTEEEPQEPVEEVQEAVAEVSPAVEEVAALPAAGQGDIGGISFTWIAIFGLAVIGFGGATALTARQRK